MSGATRPLLARGDVVLVQFPFTDLSVAKLRPALVVGRVEGDDVILAFMTSRVADGAAPGSSQRNAPNPAECPLGPHQPEFRATGLKRATLVRLNKIATVHRRLVERRLGRIGPKTERAVAAGLRHVFAC